jgi:septation ring formation regulator EzrA
MGRHITITRLMNELSALREKESRNPDEYIAVHKELSELTKELEEAMRGLSVEGFSVHRELENATTQLQHFINNKCQSYTILGPAIDALGRADNNCIVLKKFIEQII